jgi:hypothetical protein
MSFYNVILASNLKTNGFLWCFHETKVSKNHFIFTKPDSLARKFFGNKALW